MSDAPAKSPCGSCPYRQDAPSGLWHHDHYAKLQEYDLPMHEQPQAVFACHQQDGKLCAGWVGTHDMRQNMAIRIALVAGWLTVDTFKLCLNYTTKVPLFASGAEACIHGLRDYANPDERTDRISAKLLKTKKVHR